MRVVTWVRGLVAVIFLYSVINLRAGTGLGGGARAGV
jgi:hypothetical protein